jgi:hypothetical protein
MLMSFENIKRELGKKEADVLWLSCLSPCTRMWLNLISLTMSMYGIIPILQVYKVLRKTVLMIIHMLDVNRPRVQFTMGFKIPYDTGPIINAMLLKYRVLILKILLFLTCYECKILSPIPW